jgi:hypothetical protein
MSFSLTHKERSAERMRRFMSTLAALAAIGVACTGGGGIGNDAHTNVVATGGGGGMGENTHSHVIASGGGGGTGDHVRVNCGGGGGSGDLAVMT